MLQICDSSWIGCTLHHEQGNTLLPLQPTWPDPDSPSILMEATPQRWSSHPHTIVKFPTLALDKRQKKYWSPRLLLMDRDPPPRIMMTPCLALGSSQLLPKFRNLLWVLLVMWASWPNSMLFRLFWDLYLSICMPWWWFPVSGQLCQWALPSFDLARGGYFTTHILFI